MGTHTGPTSHCSAHPRISVLTTLILFEQEEPPIPAGYCLQHMGATDPDSATWLWTGGGSSVPVGCHPQDTYSKPLLLQGC